jgi:hypothetical protein
MSSALPNQTCVKCKKEMIITNFGTLASGKGFLKTCKVCQENAVKTASLVKAATAAPTTILDPIDKKPAKSKKTKIELMNEMDEHYILMKKAYLENNNKNSSIEFAKMTVFHGKLQNF